MKYIIEESLGFIISRTNQKLSNYLTRKFKSYDITPEQWGLLNRLWEKDGISQKELSEISIKDQTTVTRILDKLERKGLIKRQTSPDDRRSFLIFLTDTGRSLENKLVPIAYEVLDEALQGLSEEEIKQMKLLLNKIFMNIEK
jgi:DNA-binding MarR family transcriptional regulator